MIEKQRHKYFLVCLAVSIPTLLYFGIEDMRVGRMTEAVFVFGLCALFTLFLVVGLGRRSTALIHLSKALFSFFLLYLIHSGMGEGYGILWAYAFPLASFYPPGNRTALAWTTSFYLAMIFLLLFPGFFGGMVYEKPLVMRFLISFLIVSIMAYAYAAVRERLHARMQRELEEKNMLLNEIHHRVKNNLTVVQSILSLGLGQTSDEASRAAIMDTEARVKSMSLLHEALYSEGESSGVEISGYLGKVIRLLSDTYGSKGRGAEVSVQIPKIWFDVELAMPCGLIVNELLSNAFKYAEPREGGLQAAVSLSLLPDGAYSLSVRDNGTGLPEGFDLKSAETYGLKIVNAFVNQIGGRLEVLSGPEGTEFRMAFGPLSPSGHNNPKTQSS